MSGSIKDKDLLRTEIVNGRKKPDYYEHLSRALGFLEVKEMTKHAMKNNNTEAVLALMKSNLYAATSALSTQEGDEFLQRRAKTTQGFALIQMYFMVRTVAPPKTKKLMKNLARNVILKTSLKIAGRGMQKGLKRKRVIYYPGMSEFDLDATMNNILSLPSLDYISYRDIIGTKRTQIKKNVVLVLDTSGSMFGRALLNAALTTSVLSYVMYKDNYSVVLFNEKALFLKNMKEEVSIQKIIDDILDAEATGFTNIEVGLKKGLKELLKSKGRGRDKFGVLVTDGHYLRGDHPSKVAKDYPSLHVVGIPQEKNNVDGLIVCKETAEAGRGKYYPVNNHHEIPRTLMKILQSL